MKWQQDTAATLRPTECWGFAPTCGASGGRASGVRLPVVLHGTLQNKSRRGQLSHPPNCGSLPTRKAPLPPSLFCKGLARRRMRPCGPPPASCRVSYPASKTAGPYKQNPRCRGAWANRARRPRTRRSPVLAAPCGVAGRAGLVSWEAAPSKVPLMRNFLHLRRYASWLFGYLPGQALPAGIVAAVEVHLLRIGVRVPKGIKRLQVAAQAAKFLFLGHIEQQRG